MATFSLIVLMGLLSGVGLLLFMAERERHRAQRRVIEMEQEVAQRTRHLDLFAQELHTLGLSLMGQSPQLAQGGAEGHARALLCLAADVHDLAASTAAPRRLREECVSLAPLLREVIEQVSLAMAPGTRQWRVAPDLAALILRADRRALRGALLQVLTRAIRHTREGDPIILQLVQAEETLTILVEDEGAGLAAGDLGQSAAGDGTRGLALGLLVARQLLRAHEGELTVEAVQGIGARTWMTLPRRCLLHIAQDGPPGTPAVLLPAPAGTDVAPAGNAPEAVQAGTGRAALPLQAGGG
ncbi:sensor histidine kinase [Teichococcus aestuarii]|uniref:sensor histidine kinase n=1 Tax=Teichococcus aestuarii TaxID=568898 RepID=UPI00361EBA9F